MAALHSIKVTAQACTRGSFSKGFLLAAAAMVFAAGTFAQSMDTAYVPFRVNVDATATAQLAGGEKFEKLVRAGSTDTLHIISESATPVISGKVPKPVAMHSSRGKISLELSRQLYKGVDIALYSLNGKQVMHVKADASETIKSISHPNVRMGVYVLSVKGVGGNAFTTRLTHSGGGMNIDVAFANEKFSSGSLMEKALPGDWTITVSAEGHLDTSYAFVPEAGRGNTLVQNITLRQISSPSSSSEVVVLSSSSVEDEPSSSSSVAVVPSSSSAEDEPYSSSTEDEPSSSSSAPPSSSSITPVTLACGTVPANGISDVAIAPPALTCSSGETATVISWLGSPDWDSPEEGTYSNISVTATCGLITKTASCSGSLTVEPAKLTCGSVPASGIVGTIITPPALTCNNGKTPTDISWSASVPTWSKPERGTYSNISATATCGTSSDLTANCRGSLQVYKTVVIGTQTWMAENLNYNPGTGNSACNNGQTFNCTTYGRLYDWATAMGLSSSCNENRCSSIQPKHRGICPSEWHIPTNEELDILINYVGGSSVAGTKLKATKGWWDSVSEGTDDYGFSALPGGYGKSDGSFNDVGYYGYWWSATQYPYSYAYYRLMHSNYEYVSENSNIKSSLFSVRCLKDDTPVTCGSVPTSGTLGTAITPPTLICNNGETATDITWSESAPNWSDPVLGTYSDINATVTCGSMNGLTVNCSGTLTVEPVKLTCGSVPASGFSDVAITPPTLICNNGETATNITWTNAPNWSDPASGTYRNINATATCGTTWSTASCSGTLTVAPVLTCGSIPTNEFSFSGVAITPPDWACNNGETATDTIWSNAPNWSNPVHGTYSDISITATCGTATKTVNCDGSLQVYKTVTIGTQTWMAENLNYNTLFSKCHGDNPANCAKYGRLYDWSAAMGFLPSCNSSSCSSQIQSKHKGICPAGWHIPSDAEWDVLMDYVGGSSTAGTKLKATSGWNGTDEYGFSALPGGYGYSFSDGGFSNNNVSHRSLWWSATEGDANYAYSRDMSVGANVDRINYDKSYLYSVRCVQD